MRKPLYFSVTPIALPPCGGDGCGVPLYRPPTPPQRPFHVQSQILIMLEAHPRPSALIRG
jgi:hypothetical protein